MISKVASQGVSTRRLVTVLDVSESGYYAWRSRPPSPRSVRHGWLSQAIVEIHRDSGARFGYRRIQEELGRRYGIDVSHGTVEFLMERAGIRGKAGRPQHRILPHPTDARSHRWVIDVQVCEAARGHLYVAVVLDTVVRGLVSWSTAARADSALSRHALEAAVTGGTEGSSADTASARIVTCAFTERARLLGCAPPSAEKGNWYEHRVVEIFWERIRDELESRCRHAEPQAPKAELLSIFEDFSEKWMT
ncbi:IS3 family transposase [Streptomyces heilongjiangensis]|uniref:IS3 family transposase n=1 Tax=Streptomyces heilongjiangensis TaxID=945052 RepID=A0ABW1B8W8_9ACTN|nr:IS3 family transposase [Streptomyces heilongjiangensis]MDC2951593.1 IS3 family transposase [Streptomyces heilongjiangensis]